MRNSMDPVAPNFFHARPDPDAGRRRGAPVQVHASGGGSLVGVAPEAATAVAHSAVAAGLGLFTVGAEALGEVRAAQRGYFSGLDAASGIGLKIALSVLPTVLSRLGLMGAPIGIAAQALGGRALASARARDTRIAAAGVDASAIAQAAHWPRAVLTRHVAERMARWEETDRLVDGVLR